MTDAPTFPEDFNLADYFVFSNIAAGRGDKTAILFEDQAISYSQVAEKVTAVAERLITNGLRPEQRVLVCMQDRPEFAYVWFGAIKAGAVVTQINPLLPASDYEYYLGYAKPQFAFVDEASKDAFEVARQKSPFLPCEHAIIVGEEFDQWLAHPLDGPVEPWPTRRDDPAVWLFTSGSTGQSKGAVHRHADFPFNTEVYARDFIGIREDDVTLSGARLYFGYATGTNLMFPFAVGATTVLFREKPTPETLFELIARHRPTVLTLVPTLINKMLETAGDAPPDLSSARFAWSAGEALPRDLHARWDAAFGVPIIDGIGSAESFHIYISNRPGDIRPGSLGKLVPGYAAKLLGDDDRPVPAGGVGTLHVRGDSAALCYHGDRAKSVEHLRGGWIVSGDKFRQDEDGYWYFEGRGDDLIKSGGIYVSPVEVEACLTEHPAVRECCVLGKADANGLEKPLALVVLAAGRDTTGLEDELIAFARDRLARYKVPHAVCFRSEALPRNDRDKIDRKRLRGEI